MNPREDQHLRQHQLSLAYGHPRKVGVVDVFRAPAAVPAIAEEAAAMERSISGSSSA